jgi:lipid-binding SYLF domain-containing protein
MIDLKHSLQKTLLLLAALSMGLVSSQAYADTAQDLNNSSVQSLHTLYQSHPEAERIGQKAAAILVFPKIIKAGLIFGGAYGEGVLLKGGQPSGYYNSVSASWGWQAGAQSYGYVVFLMNKKALRYLNRSQGWEVGVGPTVVMMNEGAAKNLSSTSMRDDAYAYVFDQQGLMVSLSIEGTKISHIKR